MVGAVSRRYAKALLAIGIDGNNCDALGKEASSRSQRSFTSPKTFAMRSRIRFFRRRFAVRSSTRLRSVSRCRRRFTICSRSSSSAIA